jgi:3-deoxy-7-phosphoheptulonate synthase
MRIIMTPNASARDVAEVLRIATEESGGSHHVDISSSDGRMVISIHSDGQPIDHGRIVICHGVEAVEDSNPQYKLAGRCIPEPGGRYPVKRTVEIPFVQTCFGGHDFIVIAGPCAVENREDLLLAAWGAKRAGARMLRGGAYKPRTSPYSFPGLAEDGLEMLRMVRETVGIAIVTEAMEPATVGPVSDIADMIQIGSRNMQNFPLLREVGQQVKPVLLKRGMSATLDEWLSAAEYILSEGNPNVVLCERGIRTFSRHSRHTLDLGVIPAVRERSDLPVIVDPSHSTGSSSMVPSMSRAAVAAGADGLLVEIHPDPSRALVDGFQTLPLEVFDALMVELDRIAQAVGRAILV